MKKWPNQTLHRTAAQPVSGPFGRLGGAAVGELSVRQRYGAPSQRQCVGFTQFVCHARGSAPFATLKSGSFNGGTLNAGDLLMNAALFCRRDPVPLAVILTLVFLCCRCWGERNITITFDGSPTQPPGSRYYRTNYAELGTSFAGECGRAFPPQSTRVPDNGTAYIIPVWPGMSCSRFDGLSFGLASVDLASYSDVFPDDPASVEGHRADGSIVTTNFPVSGLAFQRYYFGPEFTNLTNVLVTAGALDNLVTRVPSVPPVLKIGTYSYHSASWMTLEARGTSGFLYRLDYSENLAGTNWTTLTNFEAYYFRNDYVTTNFPAQRFFRVVELP